MRSRVAALVALLAAAWALGIAYTARVDPVWAVLFTGLGLLYGSASVLAAARGLQYLVAVAPHAALMAAGLTPLALGAAGLEPRGSALTLATLAIGVPVVALAAYMAGRARARDEVVSGFLAVSVTAALLGIHAASRLGYWTPVSALIAGDPLLAGAWEAAAVVLLGAVAAAYTVTSIVVHVYQSVDPDDARLSGARTWLHEAAAVALIAVVTVGLVWVTGFIVQHILLLLPAIAASRASRGAGEAAILGVAVAAAASGLGAAAAIALDAPPAAGIGLLLLLATIVLVYVGRR